MLRTATEADLPRLLQINQDNVPAVGTADADHLATLLGWSLIALVDVPDIGLPGDPVPGVDPLAPLGFCVVMGPGVAYRSPNYRWFAERYADFVYLDRIAFDRRATGQGRGPAMYAEVERLARELRPGATELTLEVNLQPPNDGSLRFHRRLGFTEVGRLEPGPGKLVSLMARSLR